MVVVMPFRGEFGLKLFWHVPAVNAIEERPLVVYHEAGEEALFPAATERVLVVRNDDDLRRNRYERDRDFVNVTRMVARARWPVAKIIESLWTPEKPVPMRPFAPVPFVPQQIGEVDVVVAPRWRRYGSAKNWPHWPELTDTLMALGLSVFAGGEADSSTEVPCPQAWDFDRALDATLAAIHASKVVVATNAGLAVLAVMCGKPTVIITHGAGLTAPGPQLDQRGRAMQASYPPVDLGRYDAINHADAPIMLLPYAWQSVETVARYVTNLVLRGGTDAVA